MKTEKQVMWQVNGNFSTS